MKEVANNSIDSDSNIGLSEIRGYLSISKAAVSQMLGMPEKKGNINRDIDKNNRRNLNRHSPSSNQQNQTVVLQSRMQKSTNIPMNLSLASEAPAKKRRLGSILAGNRQRGRRKKKN
jgi:hypothetical protein